MTSAIAVVLGGDASCATNGFWSALTIATTQKLPMLFYIEDNQYGISVPSTYQTPGGDIAANLASFANLHILSGDGTEPAEAARLIDRGGRLCARRRRAGLAAADRAAARRATASRTRRPTRARNSSRPNGRAIRCPSSRPISVGSLMDEAEWEAIAREAEAAVEAARIEAEARGVADPESVHRQRLLRRRDAAARRAVDQGLSRAEIDRDAAPEGQRINMVTAIRRTLDHELEINPRMLLFGEDIGPKGGVHAVTLGLQDKFGIERVFDTSLSEEGHHRPRGRHGARRADAGARNPVPQICRAGARADQRLRDDALAHQQPLRRADGAAHAGRLLQMRRSLAQPDQRGAVRPQSGLAGGGAVQCRGCGRAAALGACAATIPIVFFEHRAMLDDVWARRPYPGDDYVLPFGRAKKTREGDQITIVTWGAMVPRCEEAAKDVSADVIDLRTLMPWDREMVLESVRRTRRCLIVHEDLRTGGFGAEIAAVVADEAFLDLDAPVARVTMPDIPSPHNPVLLDWAVPSVEKIRAKIDELVGF